MPGLEEGRIYRAEGDAASIMKNERNYPKITVTKKAEAALNGGHPWVYDEEILSVSRDPENGGLVDVVSQKGRYLGTGLLSEHSKIRIRLISRNANDSFDEAFWKRRIGYAWNYRKTVMRDDIEACRIIFGEADQFPGLTVDRYGSLLVTQCLSYGMERRKDEIFPLLVQVLREDGQEISGIFERNDVALRAREGLEENKGWYHLPEESVPESAITEIRENGIRYRVDVENGQKTGFFLDQKYNRAEVARLARGHRVLDCFTHTGSFALNAVRGGALSATAVDVSASAIEMAKENAALNGFGDRMDFIVSDVFELLPGLEEEGSPYDFIILDPPAFTKSRRTVSNALRGYKEINKRAMHLLPRGGYLATCSCSHFADELQFKAMLAEAAREAGVSLRQIEGRKQSPDHPILWGVPETDYLKFFLFQVV